MGEDPWGPWGGVDGGLKGPGSAAFAPVAGDSRDAIWNGGPGGRGGPDELDEVVDRPQATAAGGEDVWNVDEIDLGDDDM